MQLKLGRVIVLLVMSLAFLPAIASAQSQMTGLVRDESGGVLPGVTVEAASPVLIEKVRSAVTDANGRFTIVDLRQGVYTVTFSLTGFSTVVRSEFNLPGDFIATINVDLKVGALEETITVSGQTPLVDVTQAARTQVLTRDILDALPSTRNLHSVGNFVPGVRMGTPDVGGSRTMEQTSPRGKGLRTNNTVIAVDGMSINSQETNQSQTYYDDALSAEYTVQTSAQSAENSSGAMRVNSIPKDGGNIVSGAVFLGGTDGNWQSDNVSDYLKSQNFESANGIVHIQTFNGSMGGPVKRDKLWFFIAARHTSTDEFPANTPEFLIAPNGEYIRSMLDQYVRDTLGRLTWQINQKNKLAAFFQRSWKKKGKDFGFGRDPRGGAERDPHHAHLGPGQVKYTNTLTNRILVEAGYSTSYQHFAVTNQRGQGFRTPRYLADGVTWNPVWLAYAQKTDTALNINPQCAYSFGCTSWISNSNDGLTTAIRRVVVGSVSYVTGTHNLKVGFQDSFGPNHNYADRLADLTIAYRNGLPNSVTVYTTPSMSLSMVNFDLGWYVQDTWTLKRLTLTPGFRMENFRGEIEDTANRAGRFVPARFFPGKKNMPNWINNPAPRFGAAYDLFGDGRTALKFGWGKYYQQQTGNFPQTYLTSALNESRNWFDCPLNAAGTACSGAALATNGDGIAQDHEIGPSSNPNFGTRANRNPDPDIQREYSIETTGSISHQLLDSLSVSFGYYHREAYNISISDRLGVTWADYTQYTVPMPAITSPNIAGGKDVTLEGVLDPADILTVYRISPAGRSIYNAALLDKNVPHQSIYNGIDLALQGRMRGVTLIGSWTAERNRSVFCSSDDNPNGPSVNDLYTGASVSQGGRFCDQRKFDIPLTQEFKASGSYDDLPFGVGVGAVLQSYGGSARTITYQIPSALVPGGQTNSETIILNAPGTLYYPRYNQLDVNFKKNFRAGRKTFTGQVDLFNALNGSAIFTRTNAIGSSLGQVETILQGRMLRLAFQMKF
jgi:hypothetical protein